jgi:cellulose synthase/poly-beta-1,6-N-acetylglucosamine synthase-like glycosyltransferase/peptidoglycan/xylan/chitin deacetylase (PgdA/CDA1 family)/spore germination protein YaaH
VNLSPKAPLLPVFFDPNGRRRYIVTAINWGALSLAGVLITCLVLTSMAGPVLPSVKLTGPQRLLSASASPSPASTHEPAIDREHARNPIASAAAAATRYAHLITWDDNSFSSLKRNARFLDVVITEWLHLGGPDGGLVAHSPQSEVLVRRWVSANAPSLKLYPLINNYDSEGKRWDGAGATEMLASPRARGRFIEELHRYAIAGTYPGLVLDLEQLPVAAKAEYATFVDDLATKLRDSGIRLLVQVPVSDPAYDYASLSQATDGLVLMTYDEHFEEGVPGPIAGQGWFEAKLDERFAAIESSKLIVSVGSYATNWAAAGRGREMSVQEAWELLAESGAQLRFDAASLNPTFTYVDETEGNEHHVWYLDGVTAYNQVAAALAMHPGGLALWRLGTEDPSIWPAFGRGRMSDDVALEATNELQAGYDLFYRGKGEVLEVSGSHERGARTVSFDAEHNLITDQQITKFPKGTTVNRWGARADKVIALTFDDGPDPIYTPKVLDILAQKNVKATFFVVGAAGVVNADLLQRMYREGHDIGNHTFTHLNSAETSHEHIKFELNATQRLLEATIGARTRLFRPPYAMDLEPQTIDGAEALRVSGVLGYLTIGMNIDPKDWHRPLPRQIVQATVEAARRREGNVVLLHDAGGVRTPTIAALPEIIDTLRAEGFEFVTIHELLGLKRDEAMPRVNSDEALIVSLNLAGFSLISGINSLAYFLFHLGIALGTIRLIWVTIFALIHAKRERQRDDKVWTPRSMAAIIPAFNEAKVICKSVRALLASHMADFKIIVVDDGSRDGTADVVRRTFAGEPRVKVLQKNNTGKWSALNEALTYTDAEIVVTLDADTLFEPDALGLLVRHFADPSVAAVSGHAVVGNRVNLITRFQALEYVTNQNLDRRALEVVNGITVVPGAIGAWRRDALVAIGGFSSDTLAEDADATIRLELAGWKVMYEPRAVARTEAPETIGAFMKQRLRWMFGTLQVGYKNRAVMWRARPVGVGLFGLPNIMVFQFLFTLVAPLMDLMLVWTLVSSFNSYTMHPEDGVPAALMAVGTYWACFQMLEIATAALAISIDRRRKVWRLLPLLFLQRLFYRQLLYVTAIRVMFAALKGSVMGWGKLRRTGSVASETATQ